MVFGFSNSKEEKRVSAKTITLSILISFVLFGGLGLFIFDDSKAMEIWKFITTDIPFYLLVVIRIIKSIFLYILVPLFLIMGIKYFHKNMH